MNRERRMKNRRSWDEFLMQILSLLQSIERLSRGDEVDYTEYYVDLVGIMNRVGRRQEDKKIAELLCSTLEGIASNFQTLLESEKSSLLAQNTRNMGKSNSRALVNRRITGWEAQDYLWGQWFNSSTVPCVFCGNRFRFAMAEPAEASADCPLILGICSHCGAFLHASWKKETLEREATDAAEIVEIAIMSEPLRTPGGPLYLAWVRVRSLKELPNEMERGSTAMPSLISIDKEHRRGIVSKTS